MELNNKLQAQCEQPEMAPVSKHDRGWRRVIRNFTPA